MVLRARGSRLKPGQPIADDDLQFALAAGFTNSQAEQLWLEFVDYWIGVPGQRGTKLDWPATWRNRVRTQKPQGMRANGNGKSILGALDRLQQELAGGDDYPAGKADLLRISQG